MLINDDGTLPSGVTDTSLDDSINTIVTTYRDLAGDTIGDPLGNDTSTNFPNASIRILTDGMTTSPGPLVLN